MTEHSDRPVSRDGDSSGAKIQDPLEVAPPQTQEASLLERISTKWIVTFVIIALVVSALIAIWLTVYVVISDDPTEQKDFDQLSKITDPLQSIATLMIGTIFGFTVQSGASTLNKQRADKNKAEADEQHKQATENAKRAKANAKVAAVQAKTGHALRDVVDQMRQHVSADATGPQAQTMSAPVQLATAAQEAVAKADANLLDPEDFQRYLE